MPNNLPESDQLDIRDYLFIDRQRVGSLLAQMNDGLATESTQTRARSSKLLASLKLLSFGKESSDSDSTKLALADLYVSQLEEAAISQNMLADISEQVTTRKNWLRGKVRNMIEPSMLLRVTAPTQIFHVSHIIESFRGLLQNFENNSQSELVNMIDALEAMYGKSISVSIRTAGEDDFQTGFVGEIPHDFEFGPMRQELLLSQLGANATELTTLMQVAAVPTERDQKTSPEVFFQDIQTVKGKIVNSENRLDRRILDELMTVLSDYLAASGFVAAPRWPAISIIPLAIYRNVGPIPELITAGEDAASA